LTDIVAGASNSSSPGGVSSSSPNRSSKADNASFDQSRSETKASDSQNTSNATGDTKPPDKHTYRQQMEGLRNERKELKAERDSLQAGISNKTSVPEMQQEVQRLSPDLARIDREIARNDREQTALAESMKTNDVHEEGETCKITVEVKPAVIKGLPGNHSYLKMIDNDGEHYGRGGPESRVTTPESNPPWGSVYAETGRYDKNNPDWTTETRPSVTVTELPGDCASHVGKMDQIKDDINAERHDYRALFDSQSCNTTTRTMLERMGLDAPDNLPGWEPGYDKTLPKGGPADDSEDPVMTEAMP